MNIKHAIDQAKNLKSKIDTATMSQLQGLSSPRVRHLLNNLAAQSDTYLEVGCYLGGTLRAALHGNTLYAAAVDNFCLAPKLRKQFFKNTSGLTFDFFEEDSFTMDVTKIKQKIGLYFYDGDHTYESQYKAISCFLPALQHEFVYVCDDWAMKKIPNATFTAGKDHGLTVLENYDLFNTPGTTEWWNGLGVVRFKKNNQA